MRLLAYIQRANIIDETLARSDGKSKGKGFGKEGQRKAEDEAGNARRGPLGATASPGEQGLGGRRGRTVPPILSQALLVP